MKFHNQKITTDIGEKFDSKKELSRFRALQLLAKAGEIWDLKRQVKYEINYGKFHICNYIADFTYMTKAGQVVEDVKGFKTPVYRLKKKLMLGLLGISILES
jgi:hypothetical protein